MKARPTPRPVLLAGFTVIFLTFGVLGGWASVAKLDSAVVAPGTLSLEGNRRTVQHFEGGIVDEIFVDEGDVVADGDPLLRLRSIEAESNFGVLRSRLDVARLTEARLQAERALAEEITFPTLDPGAWTSEERQEAIAVQEQLFEDRRSILVSKSSILEKRMEQLEVQIDGLELQESALERRLENFTEMVDRMRDGESRGLVQANLLSQRQDELIQIEANLGQVISERAKTQNIVGETELEILQAEQQYQERANTELEEVRAEISELEKRLKVAADVLMRTEVQSPGAGTIQNLKVHTIGSVVRPGDVLMELVPENENLIVNARVSPLDIDNLTPGLETEVRLSAFKSQTTPIMLGRVETVSQDVITPENPNDPPYYLARISVPDDAIPDNIRDRLSAGMPADAVITTGERTVVQYVTSPLVDAVRKSMTEE